MEILIEINGMIIKQCTSTKFLGVTVDQYLEWNNLLKFSNKKIAKNLNIIIHILSSAI